MVVTAHPAMAPITPVVMADVNPSFTMFGPRSSLKFPPKQSPKLSSSGGESDGSSFGDGVDVTTVEVGDGAVETVVGVDGGVVKVVGVEGLVVTVVGVVGCVVTVVGGVVTVVGGDGWV